MCKAVTNYRKRKLLSGINIPEKAVESIKDDKRYGCLQTCCTVEKIKKVSPVIHQNRLQTIVQIAESVGTSEAISNLALCQNRITALIKKLGEFILADWLTAIQEAVCKGLSNFDQDRKTSELLPRSPNFYTTQH
ncbi:hypothetical protein TNCV_1642401 [Trichonephila clavipes]|nr:hypothetical protein TNCV_1642401 [Trichonephila clavipes]